MRQLITATERLAVLGSPIAHSKSPLLHSAAYAQLGLDWSYEAIEVTGATLKQFIESLDESWRGLSLTMPLKRDVIPLLHSWGNDAMTLTQSANTVLLGEGRRGFNTDVYGITEAFRAHGVSRLGHVILLGGGATAASAMYAAHELGAYKFELLLRHPMKVGVMQSLAGDLDVELTIRTLDSATEIAPDAVISTLPGHADVDIHFGSHVRKHAVLFDVAYDPWPSRLAADWSGPVISGLEMLTLQALAQVRIFVNGDPELELDDEPAVLAAMKRAVAL